MRKPQTLDTVLLLLSLGTLVGAFLVVALLRHSAYEKPLDFETVHVELTTEGANGTWRVPYPAAVDQNWQAFITARHAGAPLASLSRNAARTGGPRGIHLARNAILVSLPDWTKSHPDAKPVLELRVPTPISARFVRNVCVGGLSSLGLLALWLAWRAGRLAPATGRALTTTLLAAGVAIGFLLCWLMVQQLPPGSVDLVSVKLSDFEREGPSVDLLLLGSSQIYRHFDPARIEARALDYGHPIAAYNFGVPAMHCLELRYLLKRILKQPNSIDTIVLHCQSRPLAINPINWKTHRTVRWHDADNLRTVARWLLQPTSDSVDGAQPPASWQPRALWRLTRHVSAFLDRTSSLGEGVDRIQARKQPAANVEILEAEGASGFLSLDRQLAAGDREYRDSIQVRRERLSSRFFENLERTNLKTRPRLTDRFELELFAQIEQLCRSKGIEPIWFLAPQPRSLPNLLYAHQEGIVARLARFDRPDLTPEVFVPEMRFDRFHLNEQGAQLLSDLLAEQLYGPPTP